MPEIRHVGFTLAELLISLAILGVIATFTIPKILQAQQNQKFNAVAKEALSAIGGAYSLYKINNQVGAGTSMGDLTQYLNYTQVDTSSLVDHVPTLTSRDCSAGPYICYRLASGAILWTDTSSDAFAGTATTDAIEFFIDPDGVYSGSASGAGKSAQLYLYYTGRIASRAYIDTGTRLEGSTKNPDATLEPSWFSW